MLGIVMVWLVLAVITGVLAASKHRSGVGYFFLALLLSPIIGLLIVACLQPLEQTEAPALGTPGAAWQCPKCQYWNRSQDVLCNGLWCKHERVTVET